MCHGETESDKKKKKQFETASATASGSLASCPPSSDSKFKSVSSLLHGKVCSGLHALFDAFPCYAKALWPDGKTSLESARQSLQTARRLVVTTDLEQ